MNSMSQSQSFAPLLGAEAGQSTATRRAAGRALPAGLLVAVLLLAGCGSTPVSVSSPLDATASTSTPATADADAPEPDASESPHDTAAPTPTETTSLTAEAEQSSTCPVRAGDPARYVVSFHDWPGNLGPGQEFHCGVITGVNDEAGPKWIVVDVWDEYDFLQRTGSDANVREAEPSRRSEPVENDPTPIAPSEDG